LVLGGASYDQAELLLLLESSTRGDASLILARQLIAARLNIANGADDSVIASTIAAADDWLDDYPGKLPYDVPPSSDAGQEAVTLADTLEAYNEGRLSGGPPSCR